MALTLNGSANTIGGLAVGGLPDGIVDTDMIANDAVTAAKRGAGSILQVLQTVKTDTASTTSNSFVEISGLSQAITCSSGSNKILVLVTCNGSAAANANAGGAFQLYKDSSVVSGALGDAASNRVQAWGQCSSGNAEDWAVNTSTLQFLTTAGDTSSHTYKVYWRCETSATGSWLNRGYSDTDNSDRVRLCSTITLMEVAA